MMNPDREIIATSVDHFYYDHDDLWRWDSDFSGLIPLLDPQTFTVIWRPDLKVSYHDYGDHCVLNDGRSEMAPLPYDWFLSKTKGVTWFWMTGVWEGMPVDIFHANFVVNKYNTAVTADVYILQDDHTLVLVNGTAKNDQIDLTYIMDCVEYEHMVPITPSSLFIPSARCTNGTVIKVPDDASDGFKRECYDTQSAASIAVASWASLLMLLLLAIIF